MLRPVLSVAAILALLAGQAPAADPIRCIPDSARVMVVVDHPRQVAETVLNLDAIKQAQTLPQVRQVYDSPTARHLLRLLAFAEKELGAEWPALLDQVAGNGIALAARLGNDAPAIAVPAGTDARQVERAFQLAIRSINEEIARQGGPTPIEVERTDGVVRAHLGDEVHFARVGDVILVSNKADFLTQAIACTKAVHDSAPPKARADVARVLSPKPLAWVWLDFAAIKESKEAKDFFDSSRKDFVQTIGAGSTIDCLRRSDFVAAGVYAEGDGFRLRIRLPAGRKGLWDDLAVHIPPRGQPGSLPPLEPPGTIYSQSFHLDIGYAWKNRDRLIQGDVRKQLDMAEKAAARFLPTEMKLGELLEAWGPYHRIIVANHDKRPYAIEPSLKLPAFGYVAVMRDKKLGENVVSIARAAALLGTVQYGLKSSETPFEGVTISSYRFPENKELADDPQRVRFNFEPCFAIVGDNIVVASTVELGKKLIVELKKPQLPGAAAVWQARISAANAAEVLAGEPDSLITDAVLGRGVDLGEARKEVARLLDWLRTLGAVRIEIDMTDSEYRLDVVWKPGKK